MTSSSWRRNRVGGLLGLLGTAGAIHILRPAVFEPLIPARLRRLASSRTWVLASGAAELGCAAAVASPRTRRAGAAASAVLFVAVFPGNLQMALDYRRAGKPAWQRAIVYARLPLQWPLVALALQVRKDA